MKAEPSGRVIRVKSGTDAFGLLESECWLGRGTLVCVYVNR